MKVLQLHLLLYVGTSVLEAAGTAVRLRGHAVPTEPPLVLFFETDASRAPFGARLLRQVGRCGLQVRTLGLGSNFQGYGAKHKVIMEALTELNPERLVVVSDFEDVLLNVDFSNEGAFADRLAAEFQALAGDAPGVVLVSAEAECCVGALSRYVPGGIIAANGTRLQRTCSSGQPNCKAVWGGEVAWRNFQLDLAHARGVKFRSWIPSTGGKYRNWYAFLNAGLLAGRARDVVAIYKMLDLKDSEDDQVLMTELMFRRPDLVRLDYEQRVFGNMVHVLGNETGCVLRPQGRSLVQTETGSRPMFLHAPNHLVGCLKRVVEHQQAMSNDFAG